MTKKTSRAYNETSIILHLMSKKAKEDYCLFNPFISLSKAFLTPKEYQDEFCTTPLSILHKEPKVKDYYYRLFHQFLVLWKAILTFESVDLLLQLLYGTLSELSAGFSLWGRGGEYVRQVEVIRLPNSYSKGHCNHFVLLSLATKHLRVSHFFFYKIEIHKL